MQVPDATVAILAALAVMIVGWVLFRISESFNNEKDEE